MGEASYAGPPEVSTELYGFYRHFRPFRRYDGLPVTEFAPYQVAIWNDRFAGAHDRSYIRSPGVGLTRLLLLEALNVALASGRQADVLVVVADQFTAQRRRDELVEMLEGSSYSRCLVRPEGWTDELGTHAAYSRFGVVVRPPGVTDSKKACGVSVESVIGFDASSVNMHHVIVLDATESAFPEEKVRVGLLNARSTRILTKGSMVATMVPHRADRGLLRRFPGINSAEPGAVYEKNGSLARRIPTSIAIDAGVIERRDDNIAEVELMGRPVRDAKLPQGDG